MAAARRYLLWVNASAEAWTTLLDVYELSVDHLSESVLPEVGCFGARVGMCQKRGVAFPCMTYLKRGEAMLFNDLCATGDQVSSYTNG